MRITRYLVSAALVGGLVALPSVADAQNRGRATSRQAPRTAQRATPRTGRPPASVTRTYRTYNYRPYRPGVSLGFYYGYPWYVGPYAYGAWGYGYPYGYGYGYGYPYGYPPYGYGPAYGGYGYRASGGVRFALSQRDAEVYVDGYFAGTVDEFDGAFQRLNLETGAHHIQLTAEGFEPVEFDVNIEPGRTVTYRTSLRKSEP